MKLIKPKNPTPDSNGNIGYVDWSSVKKQWKARLAYGNYFDKYIGCFTTRESAYKALWAYYFKNA